MFTTLDELLRDAKILRTPVFRLMYGNAYRRFAADNSIVVSNTWREPVVAPYVQPRVMSHKTDPRAKDLVIFEKFDGMEVYYGHINWVSRSDDVACVYIFKDEATDTLGLDMFESVSGPGRVRWRIVL